MQSTSSYFDLSLDSNKRISFRLAHDAGKSSTYRITFKFVLVREETFIKGLLDEANAVKKGGYIQIP